MNETLNTNYYLFLKQQIVMFEAMVVKASITINDNDVDLEKLVESIKNTIKRIEFDMTPPVALLEGRKIPVNVSNLVLEIENNIDRATKDLVELNADQEKVNRLIYNYPDFPRLLKFLDETSPQENTRDSIVRLINVSQALLNTVNDWVSSRRYEGKGSFQDMLFLINYVEMIEFNFEHTNENYGA